MKRRVQPKLWTLFAAISLLLPATARAADDRSRSPLADVNELAKPVSLAETKIPLGELVQKVAADTGIPLTAAREVADEPVALAVTAMPARELLAQVADLLDYQWHRLPGHPTPNTQHRIPTLEIYQDLASKQREEALRRAVLARIERRFREELARYLEVASLSQAQIQALWEADRERSRKLEKLPPEQQRAAFASPEQQAWNRRASLVFPLWSPIARSLARLLGRLTPPQWDRLLQEGQIILSTDPEPGQLPLPEATAKDLRSSKPALNPPEMYSPADPETEQRGRDMERQGQEEWAAASGYQVRIDLDAGQLQRGGALSLNASAAPIRHSPDVIYGAAFGGANVLGAAVWINARPADLTPPPQETPERRAELENDPVLGARKRFSTSVPPQPPLGARGVPEIAWRWWLRDLLPALARTYGVQFISDAYWTHAAQIGVGSAAAEPTPLFALLDGLVSATHQWERHGNLIRLRSRTWYLDRPREIPLRLVRRWQQELEDKGALPLDDYTTMAVELSDNQLQSLEEIAAEAGMPATGDEIRDLSLGYFARKALRLYASLSAGQQDALWRGKALPLSDMLPAQRQQMIQIVQALNHDRTPPLGPAEVAAARFSLSAAPVTRVVARRHGAASLSEEPAPPSGDPGEAPPVHRAAETGAAPGAGPAPLRRYPVTRIMFKLDHGPEQEEAVGLLYVAARGTGTGEP